MSDDKPTFSAEDLAHVQQIAPWADESVPAADRLKALTALAHGTDAERQTYTEHQALVNELVRQVHGGGTAILSGSTIDTAAIAKREEELAEIAKDAHDDRPEARSRYLKNQGRMHQLAAEIVALRRGEGLDAKAPAKKVNDAKAPKPVNITDYGDIKLPTPAGEEENDPLDDRLFNEALPTFAKLGFTPAQVKELGTLFRKVEKVAQQEREATAKASAQAARVEGEKWLDKEYGKNWKQEIEYANSCLRSVLPGGKSRQLANLTLADGSVLGANPLFMKLMIEIARDTAR